MAKVVASVWGGGTDCIQFLAAPAILNKDNLKNRMNCTRMIWRNQWIHPFLQIVLVQNSWRDDELWIFFCIYHVVVVAMLWKLCHAAQLCDPDIEMRLIIRLSLQRIIENCTSLEFCTPRKIAINIFFKPQNLKPTFWFFLLFSTFRPGFLLFTSRDPEIFGFWRFRDL